MPASSTEQNEDKAEDSATAGAGPFPVSHTAPTALNEVVANVSRVGVDCKAGAVTRGCDCWQCGDLRESRMTYKQKLRLSRRRIAAKAAGTKTEA